MSEDVKVQICAQSSLRFKALSLVQVLRTIETQIAIQLLLLQQQQQQQKQQQQQ